MNRSTALVAVTGASIAFLLLLLLHVLRPDLDPASHAISEYAVGPHGWVMALAFLALAVGCAGTLIVLFRAAGSVVGRIGLVFMLAATVGLTMAAFFPMDPIEIARSSPTFTGQMHGIAAMIGNPGFMIGAVLLTLALRRHPRWAHLRVPLWSTTILMWIAFALLMAAMTAMNQPGAAEAIGFGWPNRLLWAAYCAWVLVAAWPALAAGGDLRTYGLRTY